MKKKYLKPDAEFFNFQSKEDITDDIDLGEGRLSGEGGFEEW